MLDRAVLDHPEMHEHAIVPEFAKIDEIPFDFQRRMMSCGRSHAGREGSDYQQRAPEAIFPRCKNFELDGELFPMENILIVELQEEYEQLSRDGFRVLAIASKDVAPKALPVRRTPYTQPMSAT